MGSGHWRHTVITETSSLEYSHSEQVSDTSSAIPSYSAHLFQPSVLELGSADSACDRKRGAALTRLEFVCSAGGGSCDQCCLLRHKLPSHHLRRTLSAEGTPSNFSRSLLDKSRKTCM
jgi:hypothetical protein